MSESRTVNTKRNLISGAVRRFISILLPFVARTLVLYTLGAQYQGLNSLLMSILHVLNLADLGFSTAVIYVLYKPIAEKDTDAVCAVVAYLRKVYRVVGLVMLGAGLVAVLLLPQLVSTDCPTDLNYFIPYFLYLINSVISYWGAAYKEALLTAMQREDVVNNIYSITSLALKIAQIFILVLIPNYYLYVLVLPLFTVLNNVLISHYANKLFPEIEARGVIKPEMRSNLVRQVKGIVIGKVGDVARNGFDSIFISAFIGLVAVAIYDNYYYIYSALYGLTLVVTHAMQASVGNSIATETVEKNCRDLNRFSFIFAWLTGWCSVCLCCLYQPFMILWMNGDGTMLLSNLNMVLFVLYFYAITMNNMRNMYVNGAGLFWELRAWYIAEAVGNIVLNVLLGWLFGVTGIILATIITIFLFNFIARTNVLFAAYFKRKPGEFYRKHALWFVVTAGNCLVTYLLCGLVGLTGAAGLVLKGLICIVVPNLIYVLLYHRSEQFKSSMAFVRRVLKR